MINIDRAQASSRLIQSSLRVQCNQRRWLLRRLGMSQSGRRTEPRIRRRSGPVAEQTCCGAVPLSGCDCFGGRLHSQWFL